MMNRVRSQSFLFAIGTAVLAPLLVTCTESSSDPPVATSVGAVANVLSHTSTFTTLFKSPLVIEGLTADADGNLYTAARGGTPTCPVFRVSAGGGPAAVVGTLPAPCRSLGLAFDRHGDLFVSDGIDKIYKLTPDSTAPPAGVVFASGVPGNGVAFDRAGNLWVTDGATAQGRVSRIAADGTVTEMFRVPPLANLVNAVAPPGGPEGVIQGGVGRDARALPPGSISVAPDARAAADILGSVAVVANGIAFSRDGRTAFIADSARGAIWKVDLDRDGIPSSSVGCDTTFTPNTLCLDNVFVQHPTLEGIDGIALDEIGNIWAVANERNAVVVVTPFGRAHEVFRNAPDATTKLRNAGPLEFPASPFLVGHTLCITQSDTARRDNFPNRGGEVGPAPATEQAKISCADARLPFAGLALPIH